MDLRSNLIHVWTKMHILRQFVFEYKTDSTWTSREQLYEILRRNRQS